FPDTTLSRSTKGSATNSRASTIPAFVNATEKPNGPLGPYSASRVSLATIVGSAKGRAISELTSPLPGNSSRISTHAISVPNTALIATTTSATVSVRRSAATAWGLEIDCQKAPAPPSVERTTTDASGTSTTST